MDREETAKASLDRLRVEDDVGLNADSHIGRMIELGERRGNGCFFFSKEVI